MDFSQFKREIYKRFGINLDGYKEKQLKRRIKSLMMSQGASDFGEYLKMLIQDENQWMKFLDKVTINVSEFFRNPDIFSYLENTILPESFEGKRQVKIWSAACSNGSEPYSLAMIMEDVFPGVSYEIIATDIDENILDAARKGVYDVRMLKNVTPRRLKKYFTQDDEGLYKINEDLKKNISYRKHDLLVDKYGMGYDLIVCRNVTIYFTKETQFDIYTKMNASLKPDGVLFIGATENIIQHRELGFEKISHWFYKKSAYLLQRGDEKNGQVIG
ncbi:MAG: protein-glutamate O-methyltransferase CheR [Clostridia bacterium]|nr:protein-glutamate O-methyltransferase CheR [Clostridia bacterium]